MIHGHTAIIAGVRKRIGIQGQRIRAIPRNGGGLGQDGGILPVFQNNDQDTGPGSDRK